MLDADAAAEHGYRGLVGWMRAAEALWNKYSKGKMSLVELFNLHNQLGAQFPIRQLRVVYSKAGTLPAATIVRNTRSVIENTLYWWGPNSEDEAYYLIAILNSETARARIENVQARGQFGARHFDKAMFNLPIPAFDATVALHANLARDSRAAEQIAAAIALPADVPFQRARKLVREELAADGLSTRIDQLVEELLEVE